MNSSSSCIWEALAPVSWRQSTVAFGRISVICPSLSHLEIWTPLATLLAQYLARQWIQVLRLFLEAFARISSFLFVKVNSDPAVDSRPALLFFSGRAVWRSVHNRCFDCVDCLSLWRLESGHYFLEPFKLIVTWPLFQDCMRRVRGELITQLTSSISLSDCRCIDRCGVVIHAHQVVSETTTTTTTTSRLPARVSFFPVSLLQTASAVDVSMDVDSASAARRRRERRLRQFFRHERLSVAMALPHLTRSDEGHCTAKFPWHPPPSRSSSSCLRKSLAVPGHPVWVGRGATG